MVLQFFLSKPQICWCCLPLWLLSIGDWDDCTSLLKNFLHSVYIYICIHIYICIETYHVWCPSIYFFLFSYYQVCMCSHCSLSFALHSVSTSQVNANLLSCCVILLMYMHTYEGISYTCSSMSFVVVTRALYACCYLRDLFNHVQALHNIRKRSFWYCKIKLVSICILCICLVSMIHLSYKS